MRFHHSMPFTLWIACIRSKQTNNEVSQMENNKFYFNMKQYLLGLVSFYIHISPVRSSLFILICLFVWQWKTSVLPTKVPYFIQYLAEYNNKYSEKRRLFGIGDIDRGIEPRMLHLCQHCNRLLPSHTSHYKVLTLPNTKFNNSNETLRVGWHPLCDIAILWHPFDVVEFCVLWISLG